MAPGMKIFYFIFAFFFILNQLPSGCKAGFDYSQPLPGGESAVCEPCKLGRGKCRRICLENEKTVGNCKGNFYCCRRKVI
ncbi:beta-defensin 105 [Choloepus didactylus]|uniref:beta-defensin 105 n=1 Tax=Choloepus didactylus TaxID=27675 RepID=UPI00189D4B8C|nr:beta-defensin 105 [Choloepus didactylus]